MATTDPFLGDSELSLESIGYSSGIKLPTIDVSQLPQVVEYSNSKLEPELGAPTDEYLYNCIALLFFCEKHNRVALSINERSQAVWLPFIASQSNKTWSDTTLEGISVIFAREDSELDARLSAPVPTKEILCLNILRVQLPMSHKFINRLVQLVILGSSQLNFSCCQRAKRLKWIDLEDALCSNVANLWGPEVTLSASVLVGNKSIPPEITEYSLEQAFFYMPKNNSPKNPEERMFMELKIEMKDMEKVYCDFLEHCFPSFYMTYASFYYYTSEYGKTFENIEFSTRCFKAFDFIKKNYLNFHEFILGIVSMEPGCPNNEARLKFIFRYYDNDQDTLLNEEEMAFLANDVGISAAKLKAETANKPINFSDFSHLVSKNVLNIDKVFRSPNKLIGKICQNFDNRNRNRTNHPKTFLSTSSKVETKNLCLACRERNYEFGSHCVRLDPNGRCVEPRHILDVGEEENQNSQEMTMYKYSQDYVFSTVSIGNIFLDMIRDFNRTKKDIGFFAAEENCNSFIEYATLLCHCVRCLLDCENKLIKINSPVYVIGDILGSLEDLIQMELVLWNTIPVLSCNYVMLGNYANLRKWGIECVLYLFSMKIIAPNKFFLLRGFNEIRQNSQHLQRECTQKYGEKNGQILFDMINGVFDQMALGAVIDESVICVNTGIPTSNESVRLEDFFKIENNLKDPLADPIAKEVLTNKNWTDENVMNFLKRNKLSHMIHSNQLSSEGFLISAGGHCIGISSSSHLIETPANSAKPKMSDLCVVCVDHPKLRIVKIPGKA